MSQQIPGDGSPTRCSEGSGQLGEMQCSGWIGIAWVLVLSCSISLHVVWSSLNPLVLLQKNITTTLVLLFPASIDKRAYLAVKPCSFLLLLYRQARGKECWVKNFLSQNFSKNSEAPEMLGWQVLLQPWVRWRDQPSLSQTVPATRCCEMSRENMQQKLWLLITSRVLTDMKGVPGVFICFETWRCDWTFWTLWIWVTLFSWRILVFIFQECVLQTLILLAVRGGLGEL